MPAQESGRSDSVQGTKRKYIGAAAILLVLVAVAAASAVAQAEKSRKLEAQRLEAERLAEQVREKTISELAALQKKSDVALARLAAGTVPLWSEKAAGSSDMFIGECWMEEISSGAEGFQLKMNNCRMLSGDVLIFRHEDRSNVVAQGSRAGATISDRIVRVPASKEDQAHLRSRVYRGNLVLQVAFEPGAFGDTGLRRSSTNERIEGFVSRAVAYRLVAGSDAIFRWTPFGLSESGQPASPVVMPGPKDKTRAQALRESMSLEELAYMVLNVPKAEAPRPWSRAQQSKYVEACVGARLKGRGINEGACNCNLQLLMQRFGSLVDLDSWMSDHRGESPDSELAGWFGSCLTVYGD